MPGEFTQRVAVRSRAWTIPLVLLLTALGVATALYGSMNVSWADGWPWDADGLETCVGSLAVLGIAVALVSRLARVHPAAAAALVAAVAAVGAGRSAALLLVLGLALASLIVGRRLRRAWGDEGDEALLDVLCGAGALGTLASVLAHVPVLTAGTCSLLLLAPIVLDFRVAREAVSLLVARARAASPSDPLAVLAASFGALLGVVALFPETGWDALAMHLFIPAYVAEHARWTFDATRYAWALMPTLADFVYTIVHVPGGGATAARLVNAAAMAILAVQVARLAHWAGASPRWSSFAALMFLATPLAFTVGSSLFIDAPWTAWIVGAALALLSARADAAIVPRWVTAAALLGFAAAAKAVTLPMLAVFAGVFAWQARAWHVRRPLRGLALVGVVFALAAAKPYVTAWIATGNPVFPFYVHVFGGPPFDYWRSGPARYPATIGWRTLYDITFHSRQFTEGTAGASGFQWIVLLPGALVALATAGTRRALALAAWGLALAAVVLAMTSYLRYLFPAHALLTAAIAVAGSLVASRSPWAGRALAAAAAATLAANVALLNAAAPRYPWFPLDALASESAYDAARDARVPAAMAGAVATRLPSAGSAIAYFANPVFAVSPRQHAVHPSWYSPPFQYALRDVATAEALAGVLLDFDAPLVVVEPAFDDARPWLALVLAATQPVIEWQHASVREVRAEYVYVEELAHDAALDSGERWTLVGAARHDAARGTLVVSAPAPAYQVIPARARGRYLNTVRARCDTPARYRLQVNWLDARQQPLGVALQVHECGPQWSEHAQTLVAPPGTALAVLYASGAGDETVEIDRVSLRGRR